jgi:hypothetical protein
VLLLLLISRQRVKQRGLRGDYYCAGVVGIAANRRSIGSSTTTKAIFLQLKKVLEDVHVVPLI